MIKKKHRVMSFICSFVIMLGVIISPFGDNLFSPTKAEAANVLYEFPTGGDVIKKACELLGKSYVPSGKGGLYNGSASPASSVSGVDCSGLVAWTLASLGYSTQGFGWNSPVPIDTYQWYNGVLNTSTERTVKYKGVSKTVKFEKVDVPTQNNPYVSASQRHEYWENPDGSTIKEGSIVIARRVDGNMTLDHMWFYIGEFANVKAIKDYLTSITGKDLSSYIHDTHPGSTHWRIESCYGKGVQINNGDEGKDASALNAYAIDLVDGLEFSASKTFGTSSSGYDPSKLSGWYQKSTCTFDLSVNGIKVATGTASGNENVTWSLTTAAASAGVTHKENSDKILRFSNTINKVTITETAYSKGYEPVSKTYTKTVTKDSLNTKDFSQGAITNRPKYGSLTIAKKAEKGNYSMKDMAGAEFDLYYVEYSDYFDCISVKNGVVTVLTKDPSDSKDHSSRLGKVGHYKINNDGSVTATALAVSNANNILNGYKPKANGANLNELLIGNYVLVETKAPTNPKIKLPADSKNKFVGAISANTTGLVTITATDPVEENVTISVEKVPENSELNSANYNGTEYYLFYSATAKPAIQVGEPNSLSNGFYTRSASSTNSEHIATFIIDKEGHGHLNYLSRSIYPDLNKLGGNIFAGDDGHYSLVEVKAPRNACFDDTVYYQYLTNGGTTNYTFTSEEPSPEDPMELEIYKEGAKNELNYKKSLDGTEFTVNFYLGYNNWNILTQDIKSGTKPDKTLVYTVKDGKVEFDMSSYLTSGTPYTDDDGYIIWPVGIYTVTESKSAHGFIIDNDGWTDSKGNTYSAKNGNGLVFRVVQDSDDPANAHTEILSSSNTWVSVDSLSTSAKPLSFTAVNTPETGTFSLSKNAVYSNNSTEKLSNIAFTAYYFDTNKPEYQLNYDKLLEALANNDSATYNKILENDSDARFNFATDSHGEYQSSRLLTGNYVIVEKTCDGNAGMYLAKPVTVTVVANKNTVVDTNPIKNYVPNLSTQEWDGQISGSDYKTHMSNPDSDVKIVDTVKYTNLKPDTTYTLKAIIMDVTDGTPVILRTSDGNSIQARQLIHTSKGFAPVSGSIDVKFNSFSTSNMMIGNDKNEAVKVNAAGRKFVIYEFLFNGDQTNTALTESDLNKLTNNSATVANASYTKINGKLKYIGHYDSSDINQIGYFPELHTIESDAKSLTHVSAIWDKNGTEMVTVNDTLTYKNLDPKLKYSIKVSVIDVDTKKVLGTKEVPMTITSANGTKEITGLEVPVKSNNVETNKFYITEVLYAETSQGSVVAASHTQQIDDQTGMVARIGTKVNSNKNSTGIETPNNILGVWASDKVTLTDTIELHNLNNELYTIVCEYHYVGGKHNKELVKDTNGKELKVTKTDVKLSDGTIDMVLKDLDLTNLRDETIVAYETIYFTNSKGEKVVIAQEHDDSSLTQSLRVVGVPINFIKKNQFDEVVPGSTFSLRKDTENGTEIEHWVSTSELHTTYLVDGTYFLVETDAPDGYALNEPVKFTIKAGKLYIDGEEIPSLTVVHRDPNLTSLPSTGGIGTGIFFTAGMLSMLAAAYVIKKRED